MMSISMLNEKIPDFGRDIRLNLETVLTLDGAPGLTLNQIAAIALACAYSVENLDLSKAILAEYADILTPDVIQAAKAAATIMAMNNIYYRFLYLAEDKDFSKMPARLRMNIIGRPGIPKVDFELMSLAISAISGCSSCINSHINEVKKAGISTEGIQSTVRIASVIHAAKKALTLVGTE